MKEKSIKIEILKRDYNIYDRNYNFKVVQEFEKITPGELENRSMMIFLSVRRRLSEKYHKLNQRIKLVQLRINQIQWDMLHVESDKEYENLVTVLNFAKWEMRDLKKELEIVKIKLGK